MGAEYMLMEHAPGRQLSTVWSCMSAIQRLELVKGLIEMEKKLISTNLPGYGSVYYRQDSPASDSSDSEVIDFVHGSMAVPNLVIGPVADASFRSDRLGHRNIDRGPCKFEH